MTYTEGVKILGVYRAQKRALLGGTRTVFVYAKGATDLYPELWIVVRKTFTQLAFPSPSSWTTYCIYAMGWIELYSHNDTGKVLNVPVLQTHLSQMLELAILYLPLGPWSIRSSVPAVTGSHHRDCAGRRIICHLLLPFHWSCSADSSHASVTGAFPLGMWDQLSPKSTISYSFSKLSRGKEKEE